MKKVHALVLTAAVASLIAIVVAMFASQPSDEELIARIVKHCDRIVELREQLENIQAAYIRAAEECMEEESFQQATKYNVLEMSVSLLVSFSDLNVSMAKFDLALKEIGFESEDEKYWRKIIVDHERALRRDIWDMERMLANAP